jgi:hypothetical protein
MIDPARDPGKSALARLAQSREEIRRLLDPPDDGATPPGSDFPRSRTMRALLSRRGLGTLGALASGLLIARPALALRLLRLVPAGAVGKMLLARLIAQLRRQQPS